jgi:hypothetical protein
MGAINAGYLEWRHSGGAGNSSPAADLGGVKSANKLTSPMSVAALTNITGVTVLFAAGMGEGNATFTFTAIGQTITLTIPGVLGAGLPIAIGADGKYLITGPSDVGAIIVSVVAASLPGANQADIVAVNNVLNTLYDDVSKSDSFNGDTEYRCFYLHNAHATDPFLDVVLFMGQQPTPGTVAFGKDPAGVGDGSATGVATTIANEDTAPAGVTFSTATTEGTGVSLGNINAGQSVAIWVRRVIAARNIVANPESVFVLNAQTYY